MEGAIKEWCLLPLLCAAQFFLSYKRYLVLCVGTRLLYLNEIVNERNKFLSYVEYHWIAIVCT